MDKKRTYRIRNWSEYNKTLIQRGSITIWFDDAATKWLAKKLPHQRGRPKIYSDDAILCALIIRAVYHLPLRALQGFLLSIFVLMKFTLPVPCYTRICRRAALIGQQLKKLSTGCPTDIVFDSTGVKVYGEGEWKVRQHGIGKRRTWRKIHLAICPNSHEIILSKLSDSATTDAKAAKEMVAKLPASVCSAYGDGAYDQEPFYAELYKRRIRFVVPPRKGGRLRNSRDKPWLQTRNNALKAIAGLGGDDEAKKLWKILTQYHKRSLVETAMFRFKKLFGAEFRSRKMKYQKAELFAKSLALNTMTRLGMPFGEWMIG